MNMAENFVAASSNARVLEQAVERAVRAIPPLWPLASSVAVNPFLGQSNETLAQAGARLARVAGAPVTPQRSGHRAKIATGEITDADLLEAWTRAPVDLRPANLDALKAAAQSDPPAPGALPTIADLAAACSGVDWPGLIADRFGAWAADYFDEGQALWAAPRGKSAFTAWRATAMHDLTPEISGLSGFARHAADAPDDAMAVVARVAGRLGLEATSVETAFHRMLMSLGGWAQYARWKLWQAELAGGADQTIVDLLAIRLIWEEALFLQYKPLIGEAWARVRAEHATPLTPTSDLVIDEILQEAAERASQRALVAQLSTGARQADVEKRPKMQAAFCIDVRSEVFRRALESIDPQIRTLGFAGFFGIGAAHRRFASDTEELRLPVLLNPSVRSCSGGPDTRDADDSERIRARAKRAWGRFKLAAVSSFAFVEATGPIYAGKLVSDALGLHGAAASNEPAPRFAPALDPVARIDAAAAILRAMSLTDGFARLVLLGGHGANVVNNPHASGLQCGACGGYSGEVNARLLASLLNCPDVRAGLAWRNISIPDDTLFVAALHDTTTDRVTLYEDFSSAAHVQDLGEAKRWLAAAGALTRGERALRLPRASSEKSIPARSRDWAETRPEWALAGCSAFIAAPRARTSGTNLKGRAFLHDYDWTKDKNFGVLELILTAPVVVASWISLQYYASTVAPEVFGGGNKLLHNVVGGIGVVEGNGGILRAGLPWQSVHTGSEYAHEPLRLSVYIEAPREAITDVLRKHKDVRALFDNRWLHLFAIDRETSLVWRYSGELQWVEQN